MADKDEEFDVAAVDIGEIEAHGIVDAVPVTATDYALGEPATRNSTVVAHESVHAATQRADVVPATLHENEQAEDERVQQVEEQRFEAEEADDQEQEAYEAQVEADHEAAEERREQAEREREEREEEEREEREREELEDQEDDHYTDVSD